MLSVSSGRTCRSAAWYCRDVAPCTDPGTSTPPDVRNLCSFTFHFPHAPPLHSFSLNSKLTFLVNLFLHRSSDWLPRLMGPFSVFTVFVGVISCFGAVDKTSSSFSAHGKISNFINFIILLHRTRRLRSWLCWSRSIPSSRKQPQTSSTQPETALNIPLVLGRTATHCCVSSARCNDEELWTKHINCLVTGLWEMTVTRSVHCSLPPIPNYCG